MNGRPLTSIPCVTGEDIEDAQRVLGASFDESRRRILRSNKSFDVQACPGSGKTTLLVAKLFILVKKWPHTRRGICVISHTNVARQEIEQKLAGTGIGQRMLSYPHFVGTIHSFVNAYLALPLLRSEGYHVQMIDDEAHGDRCAQLLNTRRKFRTARNFLRRREQDTPNRTIRALRYEGHNLDLNSAAGRLPCGPDTQSGRILRKIKSEVVGEGFWRFDDMFAWAERLLKYYPQVIDWVRWRFPAVLLDEAQDTSELQARLLHKIFPTGECRLRQRFGDSNQAIYDTEQSQAKTDKFPAGRFRSITDSKRFGAEIAGLAHPVAPEPMEPKLHGSGPRPLADAPDRASINHTIFLFSQGAADKVLPAFGELLLETFPDEVLRGYGFLARAIGRVGASQQGEDKVPRHLGDYWNGYEAGTAKLEPRLGRLIEYVQLAQHRRVGTEECSESFRLVMRGVRELVRLVKPGVIPSRVLTSRWIMEALKSDTESLQSLRRLLWDWIIEARPLGDEYWRKAVDVLKSALIPILDGEWNDDAETFCHKSTRQFALSLVKTSGEPAELNSYRFEHSDRYVDIDVGTIHSAKGQTHTATLVLETFAWQHDLEDLLPWLSGQKTGAAQKDSLRRKERMRLIYTAMTRPSHLLCLALRRSVVDAATRRRLIDCGWRVIDLEGNGSQNPK